MSYASAFAFLREHNLLHGVPEHELSDTASAIETVMFADGQPLVVEGEASNDCFFVSDGKVQVTSRNLIGNTVLLAELGPGSLVGEIGLLRNERRSARVTAIGDVTALRLDRPTFDRLAVSSPLFHESLLLTVRIRMIHRLLRNASIWSAIPDAELRGLAEITKIKKVSKGETIVKAGELVEQFYMISEGRLEARDAKKRRTTLLNGDFFGETGVLTDTSSELEIVAAEDSELLVMGKSEFHYILSYYAPVRAQFMEILRIRSPHLLSKVTPDIGEAPKADETKSVLPKAKERWVELLLWLGGAFVALSLTAMFLKNDWLNYAALVIGGIVGPVTFVSYIRSHQLLGFGQARLGMIFAISAIVAVPLAWYVEREWLFGEGAAPFHFGPITLPLSISVIEESAKLIVCIALVRSRQMHFLMDAVVFGAAAGMGFAAIESVIYGWAHIGDASSVGMLSVLWMRALLSPFGHGTWTAIATAGIWVGFAALKSKSRLWSKVSGAIVLLAIVIALHAMWDYHLATGLAKMGMMVAVGCVGLTLLYALIRAGKREEFHAFATLNPYVQEALSHVDPSDYNASELHCEGCGTVSPRETRYCARCGRALRIK
ncbi:cyclic nucleotide-binding domain-containing protein [Cohnella yongneupensis]|uniref:Cyclic nucleotide-binding domain-containing protein n=1 Tax=Cohnella yongneupensis TaxID=425006 RepID=A0ABW0R145_9BACL